MARKKRWTEICRPTSREAIKCFFKGETLKNKEKAMYAIIAMGEEPYCIEIPCMVFMTKQAVEGYLSKIPGLQRCGEPGKVYADGSEDLTMYKIPDELYDEIVPPDSLANLPQNMIASVKKKITYGKAAGLHFFTFYNDRRDSVYDYFIKQVKLGEALVGFGGMWVSKRKV
jgi:hypothetical protein